MKSMKWEKILYKITFIGQIMWFYVTSGLYYSVFEDFKENRKLSTTINN